MIKKTVVEIRYDKKNLKQLELVSELLEEMLKINLTFLRRLSCLLIILDNISLIFIALLLIDFMQLIYVNFTVILFYVLVSSMYLTWVQTTSTRKNIREIYRHQKTIDRLKKEYIKTGQ